MSLDSFRDAVVLTGPTASGKTETALTWADRADAEIVSMDSMAVYRGMDIGTAKVRPEVRERVPHHLVDVLDPWESGSVAWWLGQARLSCDAIRQRGKRILIVGGTPLYLKALLFGLFDGPPADEAIRQRLGREAESAGPAAFFERLRQADPASAQRLHPNDLRRVIRALEVWELTGKPLSAWQTQWPAATDDNGAGRPTVLCLDPPRSELYARIDRRVVRMFDEGWLEEARWLRSLPRPLSKEASQAVGYAEVFAHLDGEVSLDEAVRRIQTRTRQFAKRQLTWLRHLPGMRRVSNELTSDPWGLKMT